MYTPCSDLHRWTCGNAERHPSPGPPDLSVQIQDILCVHYERWGDVRPTNKGMKWEPHALTTARYGSVLLLCVLPHLRRYEDVLVAGTWMHSWGSRGRRFKSGRPDY